MRIRLDVAAPIRAGGREQQINKLEFVLHRGKLHAISPRKLARLLLDNSERSLGDWNTEVLTRGQNADLTGFLSREGLLTPGALENITRYSALCDHQRINQFQPHARDAFGRLFIPGSAIKGAIRSAVMYALVDEEKANRYVRNSNQRNARFYAGRLDQDTLQSYDLPNRDLRSGPHFDLLRAVKVADAYGELNSRVEKITIQSYTEDRRGRTASLGASNTIYVECLVPGSWVEFDLEVDQKILADFESRNEGLPFGNEAELMSLVRDFYAEVWSRERRYYGVEESGSADQEPAEEPEKFPELEEWIEQNYGKLSKTQQRRYRGEYRVAREEFEAGRGGKEQPSKTNPGVRDGAIKVGKIRDFYGKAPASFRLGWGSGLLSTTVDMRLDEDNMGKVLNLVNSRHNSGAPIDGPKSRKLVGPDNNPNSPMGWARLEVL
jgi:CRISPR-associated protein Csm5